MKKYILISAIVILALIALMSVQITRATRPASRIDYNCPDFSTQEQAQKKLEDSLDKYGKDIYRLDGDGDGVACESLKKVGD